VGGVTPFFRSVGTTTQFCRVNYVANDATNFVELVQTIHRTRFGQRRRRDAIGVVVVAVTECIAQLIALVHGLGGTLQKIGRCLEFRNGKKTVV
jgi:hypothetical protein